MNLDSTYAHLRDDRSVVSIEVAKTFWEELSSNARPELDPGRLLMTFSFTEDWPTWEVHPAGDEVVALISGEATLVLETPNGEHLLELTKPGDFAIVPRGVWHTARIKRPTTMFFITPGEGTENRPR
jgi:mannose-6-phosphate isomerase-like protein (cupin superfamily)